MNRSKKDAALKQIISKIRRSPVTRKDFSEMPDATYYDNLKRARYLGIAKELVDGRLAWIDYSDIEEEVRLFIEDFELIHCRWPNIEEISLGVGLEPDKVRLEAYKLAPRTGWKPPTDLDIKNSTSKILSRLELAAWVELGWDVTHNIDARWTSEELRKAQRILKHKKYYQYVPEINAFRYKGQGDTIHYECAFFDLDEITSGLTVGGPLVAASWMRPDQLEKCGKKLKIEERPPPSPRA